MSILKMEKVRLGRLGWFVTVPWLVMGRVRHGPGSLTLSPMLLHAHRYQDRAAPGEAAPCTSCPAAAGPPASAAERGVGLHQ